MTSDSIIQNLFSITWLTGLWQTAEHWLQRYWYFLIQFLGKSKAINSFLAHINTANSRISLGLYHYFKKTITDHTGLPGFVRTIGADHENY
jgi:hypothetical protein